MAGVGLLLVEPTFAFMGTDPAVTAAGVFGDLLRTVWRPLDN